MTRPELRSYATTFGGALALIALILGAQSLLDRLERDTEDRLTYQQWIADACIPSREGQRAIATHEGARLHCTIYTNTGYGLAPVVVSAAVMEVPQ